MCRNRLFTRPAPSLGIESAPEEWELDLRVWCKLSARKGSSIPIIRTECRCWRYFHYLGGFHEFENSCRTFPSSCPREHAELWWFQNPVVVKRLSHHNIKFWGEESARKFISSVRREWGWGETFQNTGALGCVCWSMWERERRREWSI